MLERRWPPIAEQRNLLRQELDREFISLADIVAFARRYILSIVAFIGLGLLGAGFYIATTDPIFTAGTQILIEPKISQLLQQQTAEVNLSLDTAQVESQIAVMQSEKIAKMVIDELGLLDDPGFNQSRSPTMGDRFERLGTIIATATGLQDSPGFQSVADFIGKNLPFWGADEPPPVLSEFQRNRRTMDIFQSSLGIRRMGVSYAIEISFSSQNAEEAAKIANAMAEAFVREQLETKASAAREGGAWLERRIKELRTQMNTATQIAQEFRARHDYRVGRPIETAPAEGQAAPEGDQAGIDGPTLEELEVTADTYRKMYESFLQAFTSSVSQQSYPVADARVITPATPPLTISNPRKKLVMAFGALAGIMAGVGFAFARHTLDRSVRSARQIRDEIGLECIGELPAVNNRRGGFARLDEVARSPRSRFSDGLRDVKTAISLADATHPIRCLGVTSALPGDGKSSFASNLAMLYAMSGMRTLVIDADIYHAALTTRLVTSPPLVTTETRGGSELITRQIASVSNQWFDILPSSTSDANHLLAPKNMQTLLPDLQAYDMVVVDLPPLTSGIEKLAIGPLLDGVIIVAEWGKTPMDMVSELSRSLRATKTSIIGVVMTKVRIPSARRYRRRAKYVPR